MAKDANKKKKAHLSDLFNIGEKTVVTDISGNEYPIWLARPTALQQEDAREKANGKMARFKREAKDKDSDKYIALQVAVDELDHKGLVDQRCLHNESELREQSVNEVLYGEFGDDWSTDDVYFSLITAIQNRYAEIDKFNESMSEGGSDERIDLDEDDELNGLQEQQDNFTRQTSDRFEELMDSERIKHDVKTDEDLRVDLISLALELEAKMSWYETYQVRMLYYACRYPDDTAKFYFKDPESVLEMPSYIRTQLYQSYELMDRGSDDLKNSLSLLSSSA